MAEEVVVEPERKEKRKEKNPPAAFSLHQHRYQSVVILLYPSPRSSD